MSSAELTAYLAGRDVGLDLAEQVKDDDVRVVAARPRWTKDEQASLDKLGADLFAYWVARGAHDGAYEMDPDDLLKGV